MESRPSSKLGKIMHNGYYHIGQVGKMLDMEITYMIDLFPYRSSSGRRRMFMAQVYRNIIFFSEVRLVSVV